MTQTQLVTRQLKRKLISTTFFKRIMIQKKSEGKVDRNFCTI
jgi:hypothetical protein